MKFYNNEHSYYCGIDLHAKTMYICLIDSSGKKLVHRNIRNDSEYFLKILEPYREDVVVCVECIFSWYWLADLCAAHKIPFVLGHALYMRAIHGGKVKNDKVDSEKIASLLRGGLIPNAYVYPKQKRAARDLMRRRTYFVRQRGTLIAHCQILKHQYNLAPIPKKVVYKGNQEGIVEHFPDEVVQESVASNLAVINGLTTTINKLEWRLSKLAKEYDEASYQVLQSIKGVGMVLAMTIQYEVDDISRFSRVQDFLSYSRLVKCLKESGGKIYGSGGRKMGNAHLKWAFSEAVLLMMANYPEAKKLVQRLERKHSKGKALAIMRAKLGRAIYYMLKRKKVFDRDRFFAQ